MIFKTLTGGSKRLSKAKIKALEELEFTCPGCQQHFYYNNA